MQRFHESRLDGARRIDRRPAPRPAILLQIAKYRARPAAMTDNGSQTIHRSRPGFLFYTPRSGSLQISVVLPWPLTSLLPKGHKDPAEAPIAIGWRCPIPNLR